MYRELTSLTVVAIISSLALGCAATPEESEEMSATESASTLGETSKRAKLTFVRDSVKVRKVDGQGHVEVSATTKNNVMFASAATRFMSVWCAVPLPSVLEDRDLVIFAPNRTVECFPTRKAFDYAFTRPSNGETYDVAPLPLQLACRVGAAANFLDCRTDVESSEGPSCHNADGGRYSSGATRGPFLCVEGIWALFEEQGA